MNPTCRVANCDSPSERLPEDMEHLGVPLCEEHAERIRAAAAHIEDPDWRRCAIMVEARRVVYPLEGIATLSVIQGGGT
jgi:hypothetical protein